MRLVTLAAVTSFAASPAFALCLTSADLDRGIVVRFESGDSATMRRQGDGYLQIDEAYASGNPTTRFRAHRGIYFVEEFELGANGQPVPGTRLQIEFPFDPAILPDPLPGLTWTGQTVNVFDDGSTRNETTSVRFTAGGTLRLSDCDYEVIHADLRYDWGAEGGLTLRYEYLPAVQTAILISSQFDGDAVLTNQPIALQRMGK